TDLHVEKTEDNAVRAVVQGQAKATVRLLPTAKAAPMLRVIPSEGIELTASWPVSVGVTKAEGKWQIVDGTMKAGEADSTLPVDDQQRARQFVLGAASALLTYTGDLDTYNRAQGTFYATKA